PKLTFDKTKATFLVSAMALPSALLAAKKTTKLLTKKMLIMLSVVSLTVMIASLLFTTNVNVQRPELIQKNNFFHTVKGEVRKNTETSIDTVDLKSADIQSVEKSRKQEIEVERIPLAPIIPINVDLGLTKYPEKREHIKSYKERFEINQ